MPRLVMTVESSSVDVAGTNVVFPEPAAPVSAAASVKDDEDEKTSVKVEETVTDPHHGLTDQTNFLPARQVFVVFCGLSVALACAFLDQTMYVTPQSWSLPV